MAPLDSPYMVSYSCIIVTYELTWLLHEIRKASGSLYRARSTRVAKLGQTAREQGGGGRSV